MEDNIEGFEGYHVTKDGRIFSRRLAGNSKKHRFSDKWRERKSFTDKFGRKKITLRKLNSEKVYNFKIHNLVLKAYVGPRPIGMECCHYDGNSSNNKLENLRWDTSKNNKQDMKRHGRTVNGERISHAKLKESNILEILELRKTGKLYKEIAKQYNVHATCICRIIKGRRWQHLNLVKN